MTTTPTTSLVHGTGGLTLPMPTLGYGVYKVKPDEAEQHVRAALDMGYRLIDTAKLYGNEEGVGAAVRGSGLARDEVFVTTKLWNDDQGYDEARRAFDASMERLGLDYVDLFLIHWPQAGRGRYVETWKALLELQKEGRVKAVGVSNFTIEHLQRIQDETGELPAVNQVERHPYLAQRELAAWQAERGIVTEAWSPLYRGRGLLADPVVAAVAEEKGVTPAQVVLAWHRQTGVVAIPKSVTPSRMQENLDSLTVELDDDELARIRDRDRDERIGPNPDEFND